MPGLERQFTFRAGIAHPQRPPRPWPRLEAARAPQAVVRTVLVDDHPLFRQGARDLMEASGTFRVVGEAGSGREGISLARSLEPELVLLDLRLGDMDGTHVLYRMREAQVDARIAMITASRDPEDMQSALRAGADAYLLKDAEPAALLQQLRNVVAGHLVLGEGLGESLARSLRPDHPCQALERAGLTLREREILQCLADGCSNLGIARRLDIAESTVKVHVKHLLQKLGLHSRVEAALWCLKQQGSGGTAGSGSDERR